MGSLNFEFRASRKWVNQVICPLYELQSSAALALLNWVILLQQLGWSRVSKTITSCVYKAGKLSPQFKHIEIILGNYRVVCRYIYTFRYPLLFIETLTFEQKNNSLCLKNCIWKINIFLNCYDHFLVQTGVQKWWLQQ